MDIFILSGSLYEEWEERREREKDIGESESFCCQLVGMLDGGRQTNLKHQMQRRQS